MSDPILKVVDLDDSHIQYLHYPGSGPSIIMLHATGFLPWLWHPIARELNSQQSFDIVSPYFCDHRETDPNKGGLHWALLAQDLYRMCLQLNIKKPLLIGHSMGAVVATLSHTVYKLQAKRMILIEPIFLPDPYYQTMTPVEQHPLAGKSIRRRNFWKDKNEAYQYLRSKTFFQNWDEEMLQLYIRHGMMASDDGGLTLTCSPKREAALFMGGMHHNPWPLLDQIQCPTLIIEGGTSENQQVIDLKKATNMIPQGTYQRVEKAGHLIPMEFPVACLGMFLKFIDKENDL
jgi:pimeloyl-ACP methyl ester carboxylesterase